MSRWRTCWHTSARCSSGATPGRLFLAVSQRRRGMLRTHVSCVIGAPIAAVWKAIRPFDSLATWHPYIAASSIEGQHPADKVGGIRRLQLRDGGGIVRETLLALSDLDHSIVYDIIESNMPVENYI